MSFTLRPVTRRSRHTSRLEDRHMVKNACVLLTASSVAFQAQVASSLGAPVSFRIIRKRLAEGHLGSRLPLRVLPFTTTHRCFRLEWCQARGN
ncbi:transposable element Tcb2 transposase [Trichonephila clavipes]|nr:transposable element Tcb2 transposase [Trichonephila clavipes]